MIFEVKDGTWEPLALEDIMEKNEKVFERRLGILWEFVLAEVEVRILYDAE